MADVPTPPARRRRASPSRLVHLRRWSAAEAETDDDDLAPLWYLAIPLLAGVVALADGTSVRAALGVVDVFLVIPLVALAACASQHGVAFAHILWRISDGPEPTPPV